MSALLGWLARKSSNIHDWTKESSSKWSVNIRDFFERSIWSFEFVSSAFRNRQLWHGKAFDFKKLALYSVSYKPLLTFLLQGRNPFYVEPAMVICITDGSKLSAQGGIQEEVHVIKLSSHWFMNLIKSIYFCKMTSSLFGGKFTITM